MRKKIFTALVIASACVYLLVLYVLLFAGLGRANVLMAPGMRLRYSYNLIPLKTIIEYVGMIASGTARGSAIRNLVGNVLLLMPLGFYLPFFVPKAARLKTYAPVAAILIIFIEVVQLVTKTGSLDVDDFILNFAGALIGFLLCMHTPLRGLFNWRAWRKDEITANPEP